MQPILRGDGHWVIYRVEVWCKLQKGHEWIDAGGNDQFLKNIPHHIRFVDVANHYKLLEPFHAFSASGDCWQRTGFLASFEFDPAVQMMRVLAKYHPGTKFRVVAHAVTQTRVPLAEYSVKPRGRRKNATRNVKDAD